MSPQSSSRTARRDPGGMPTNGSGAAAILAAGIGTFALALLAVVADHVPWLRKGMIFYHPTGPLSGVTSSGVFVWLVVWAWLEWRWRSRSVALGRIANLALVLLLLALVLTFPPIGDIF